MKPRAVIAWTLHDFANSSLAAAIMATILRGRVSGYRAAREGGREVVAGIRTVLAAEVAS